jgi:glycosyltransferase involved in cell wall biosynthesis
VGIVGKPNTGKSSILNALLDYDRAIVSDVAGTTRDIVEGVIEYNGVRFNFSDTAGIRESSDEIESVGIKRSETLLNDCDVCVGVLDGSKPMGDDDKKVLEQKKWRAEEPRAKRLLAWERKLFTMPDFITWDTSCHVDFAAEYLNVPREKMCPLFTGTDEEVFKPVATESTLEDDGVFKILYHGAYLPLHGTETIVEAARITQDLPIRWDFLGWGAYKAETEAKAAGLKNVRFLDKVPYVEVPKVICSHDIVLGVFGTTAKAARVIGNKVYECMACARPTINEFCTGYPPSAKDCKAIKFIPAGDAAALVKAVEQYRTDWANKETYFAAAREFFERELSFEVVKRQMVGVLKHLMPEDM